MVTFGSGYYHPMDRDYTSSGGKMTNDVGLSIGDIGFSTGLGPTPNIPRLGATMRTGQKLMELTFMGQGKGSGRGHTPGMYGEKQRQALREMQKANKYTFTTHATVGIMGMSGMDQQGNFAKQNKQRNLDEIDRAIQFAADVTGGGPIVLHTGEFHRHISEAKWNQEGNWSGRFKAFEDEDNRAAWRVIDRRTGGVVADARKNRDVPRPVWLQYNEEKNPDLWKEKAGGIYVDNHGNRVKPGDFVDYEGNLITNAEERVPTFDKKESHFKVEYKDWQSFQQEAEEMTQRARDAYQSYHSGKMSKKKLEQSIWRERIKKAKSVEDIKIQPEEAYVIAQLETNAANARGWAYQYSGNFDERVQEINKLTKAKNIYDQLEQMEGEKKEAAKKEADTLIRESGITLPPGLSPQTILAPRIEEIRSRLKQAQAGAYSQWAQAENTAEQIRHIQSADTYALEESYDAYAQAGIKAMMESNKLEKKGGLRKPIALAIENLFPGQFGGHPDELVEVIKGSRKAMAQKLQTQGMSATKADELAKKHIFATFDTAHMNLWWKHWQGDQKKTFEENRKDFDKWYLEKIEMLAKEKIVGHLHLVDNYGYEDEHLAPGEGNTPVTKALKIFKKHGFDGDVIIEPGADFDMDTSGTQTLLKAWRHFGSPIYGSASGRGGGRGWGNVQHGYFGMTQPPYFMTRPYAPSEDWTLWSGVPLE